MHVQGADRRLIRFASARRPREIQLLPLALGRNHVSTNSAFCELTRPHAAVTDLPADVSEALLGVSAANDSGRPEADGQCYFEIYRADEVRLTSILLSGGDWRWQFRSGSGALLATSAGYTSEQECATAVVALRSGAGSATILSGRGASLELS